MPPKQCPACGRFLTNALVEAVRGAGAPCPGCGEDLTAASFHGRDTATVRQVLGASTAAELRTRSEVSVRPPDLAPDLVRAEADDVLLAWDHGVGEDEIAAWSRDRRPLPRDTMAFVGAGVAGVLIGALVGDERRVRGASIGAVGGLMTASFALRIWRLPG